jgi:hypothetical protein
MVLSCGKDNKTISITKKNYLILFSSKNSTIPLIAQTNPQVNIPSKKNPINLFTSNTGVTNPPNVIDMKKPTHVDVHIIHVINVPKKFDLAFIFSLKDSKIEP